MIDNEPWMVGKDIAEALGYTDAFGALKKHVDDEDKQNCQNDSFNSPRGISHRKIHRPDGETQEKHWCSIFWGWQQPKIHAYMTAVTAVSGTFPEKVKSIMPSKKVELFGR